jgi:hypothetical protein
MRPVSVNKKPRGKAGLASFEAADLTLMEQRHSIRGASDEAPHPSEQQQIAD